jgi:hypothetical protein
MKHHLVILRKEVVNNANTVNMQTTRATDFKTAGGYARQSSKVS